MMRIKLFSFTPALAVLCALVLTACPGDGEDVGEEGTESTETGEDLVCDPEGAIPEVGALLNAPVADDVEIIVKTPQHPGAPGPAALP